MKHETPEQQSVNGASPDPTSSHQPEDTRLTGASLKRVIARGTAIVMTGYALSNTLRLGGNLILTRLLFPEAYGLMTVVTVILTGIHLFTEIGIRGSIVYHKRGEDPDFLNTAWTMQAVRGVMIWLLVSAFAAPLATFYEKPELRLLLPVLGLTAILEGLTSTARFTLVRRISPLRQVMLEIVARVISLCVMIVVAWLWPSVWALAAGSLVMSLVTSIGSHKLIPDFRNRFKFDTTAFKSQINFGRWILLSTIIGFLVNQGDRLFFSKILTSEQLGIYAVAILFTEGLLQPIENLASNILQPFYAALSRQKDSQTNNETLRKIFKARAVLLAATIPPVWCLIIFGNHLIHFLYDPRYWDAGWMLRILSIGIIGSIINVTTDKSILAVGDSQGYLVLQIFRSILLIAGMVSGYALGEIGGLLIGLSAAKIMGYIPLAYFLRLHGVWLPKLDLSVFGLSFFVISSAVYVVGW